MNTSSTRSALPLFLLLLLAHPQAFAQAEAGPAQPCKERYHEEISFLVNPDEAVLIAAGIGWSRKNKHRLLWDERYAATARQWSGYLVESGDPKNKSLPMNRLRFELALRGVTDGAVIPFSAIGPGERVPGGMMKFLDRNAISGRFTHFAVGATRTPDQKRMVTTLLLGRRPVLIDPLPVCPSPGSRIKLRARILRGYTHPRWLMTTPKGNVTQGILLYEEGAWSSEMPLDGGAGEYTTELVVNGPRGPEVAALFPLYVGVPKANLPRVKLRPAPGRYRSPEDAEKAILSMVNEARGRLSLPPLILSEDLSKLARSHADELLFKRHAEHRSQQTGSLVDRLRKAGVVFQRALENVALVPSPEAAHERLMGSPGHRLNLIDPHVSKIGIGVAMERSSTEDILAVCQVFVEPPVSAKDDASIRDLHRAINARRLKRGRFALGLDRELSAAAQRSARRLSALGRKADPQQEGEALLEEITDLGAQEVELRYFHTANVNQILAAPEIYDENINRLGIGTATDQGGSGLQWLAVVFAAR